MSPAELDELGEQRLRARDQSTRAAREREVVPPRGDLRPHRSMSRVIRSSTDRPAGSTRRPRRRRAPRAPRRSARPARRGPRAGRRSAGRVHRAVVGDSRSILQKRTRSRQCRRRGRTGIGHVSGFPSRWLDPPARRRQSRSVAVRTPVGPAEAGRGGARAARARGTQPLNRDSWSPDRSNRVEAEQRSRSATPRPRGPPITHVVGLETVPFAGIDLCSQQRGALQLWLTSSAQLRQHHEKPHQALVRGDSRVPPQHGVAQHRRPLSIFPLPPHSNRAARDVPDHVHVPESTPRTATEVRRPASSRSSKRSRAARPGRDATAGEADPAQTRAGGQSPGARSARVLAARA